MYSCRVLDRDRQLAYVKEWRSKNPEKQRAYVRKYNAAHKEAHAASNAAWKMKRLYGLSLEDFGGLWAAQGFVCAVCGSVPRAMKGGRDGRCVDHDHETGRVRGILCNGCNMALGYVRDSPATLRALAEYLERNA